ncbi:MAG: hypothetical protein MZV63_09765 [Marinilabiliales bacterium]|nr:hypothetical protein [Marinilabiliales bacterium]
MPAGAAPVTRARSSLQSILDRCGPGRAEAGRRQRRGVGRVDPVGLRRRGAAAAARSHARCCSRSSAASSSFRRASIAARCCSSSSLIAGRRRERRGQARLVADGLVLEQPDLRPQLVDQPGIQGLLGRRLRGRVETHLGLLVVRRGQCTGRQVHDRRRPATRVGFLLVAHGHGHDGPVQHVLHAERVAHEAVEVGTHLRGRLGNGEHDAALTRISAADAHHGRCAGERLGRPRPRAPAAPAHPSSAAAGSERTWSTRSRWSRPPRRSHPASAEPG